jgi:hypothetical protein
MNLQLNLQNLQPHQLRVIEEKRELDERRQKLGDFLSSPNFFKVPEPERSLLKHQVYAMAELSSILGQRIGSWQGPDDEMVIYRRIAKPSSDNPMAIGYEEVAVTKRHLAEHGVPPLGKDGHQSIIFLTRAELDEKYPEMVRL